MSVYPSSQVDPESRVDPASQVPYRGIAAFARHMHDLAPGPEDIRRNFKVFSVKRVSVETEFSNEGIYFEFVLSIGCGVEDCEGCGVYEFVPRKFPIFENIDRWLFGPVESKPSNPFLGLERGDMLGTHGHLLFMGVREHALANTGLSSDKEFDKLINWGDQRSRVTVELCRVVIPDEKVDYMRNVFRETIQANYIQQHFDDPIQLLAFMVFMADVLPESDSYHPKILLDGHGSLPASKIRNLVEVSPVNVVVVSAPGFVVNQQERDGLIQGTTE